MKTKYPQKAELLKKLKQGDFNVPDFIYLAAEDFRNDNFEPLEHFFSKNKHEGDYKVIVRSAHPLEEFYKGGTFDSIDTYSDVGGVKYARKRMIKLAKTSKRLSILRQQKFNNAPELDPEDMNVIVMPFIEGGSVMAKMIGDHWEFGFSRDRTCKVQNEPYITQTPFNRELLQVSEDIQQYLGFKCEIEYIITEENELYVVQAKDISNIEMLEEEESARSIRMDGLHRIRKRRNYRERPVFVMDNNAFLLNVISKCEDLVIGCEGSPPGIEDILAPICDYEKEMEQFALRNHRYAVIGLCILVPEDLRQITFHYLDDTPDLQKTLSKALCENSYKVDNFLNEADTVIARDKIRLNLCSHDAYGIDTVRNPLWSVYWLNENHTKVVNELRRLGYETGDTVGIDINADEKPVIFRL